MTLATTGKKTLAIDRIHELQDNLRVGDHATRQEPT